MMTRRSFPIGSGERPLQVAIVGSGPSGFYTAGALLKQKDLHLKVDMFERLAMPYGLVRYGVAPDHQKTKQVIRVYEATAGDPALPILRQRPGGPRPAGEGAARALRSDRLRRRLRVGPAVGHPGRGSAGQPYGHGVRGLVQRSSRLSRPPVRSDRAASGGGGRGQRGHGRHSNPGAGSGRLGLDRYRRARLASPSQELG